MGGGRLLAQATARLQAADGVRGALVGATTRRSLSRMTTGSLLVAATPWPDLSFTTPSPYGYPSPTRWPLPHPIMSQPCRRF